MIKLAFFSTISFAKRHFIIFVYLVLYGLLFLPLIIGGGNYWDWNIPYFSEHLKNMAINYSWSDANFGGPLGYASSIYLNDLFSLVSYLKLPPELFLYSIIIIPATFASYFTFLLTRRFSNGYLGFILGLVAVLNPAYFYKILAGHTFYFFSFAIFIGLIYYLLTCFQKNLKSAIALGLILVFCVSQTQFFIFSALVLAIYFIVYREKFSLKYFSLTALIVVIANIPWLLNFFNGSISASTVAGIAKADAFYDLSHGSLIYIFSLLFSKATLIHYFYPKIFLIFFLGLSAIAFYSLIIGKKNKEYSFLLLCFLIFIVGATGITNSFNFFPFNYLSSILREVGHFAPIVVLFILLLISFSFAKQIKIFKTLTSLYLVVFLLINLYIFLGYVHIPVPNFSHVRVEFSKYEIQNKSDLSTYKVLTYPFFGQYSFNDVEKNYVGGDPSGSLKNNSGWDNYTNNSGKENINNSLTVSSFEDSLQLRFTKNRDLSELEDLGIKYIYDYSGIYTSNIEKYIPATLFDSNLDLIKNPNFIKDLSKQFPDRLENISSGVYRLNRTKPRIYLDRPDDANLYFEKIDPTLYKVTIKNMNSTNTLNFLNSFNPQWNIFAAESDINNCAEINRSKVLNVTECEMDSSTDIFSNISIMKNKPLFEASHKKTDNGMNQWEITSTLSGEDVSFYIFFKPQLLFSVSFVVAVATIILSFIGLFVFNRNNLQKDN